MTGTEASAQLTVSRGLLWEAPWAVGPAVQSTQFNKQPSRQHPGVDRIIDGIPQAWQLC